MQSFPSSPVESIASAWRHRGLIGSLTQREVLGRYRGSTMGLLWAFLNPLFMLAVYTFVFSVVFKARWSAGGESRTEFALVLFAGLLVFNLFSECVNRAPSLILGNVNFVKKVVFPLEILTWVTFLSALFHMVVSLAVWFLAYLVFVGLPHPTALLLPVVLMPLALLTVGVTWAIASLGVYLRDVAQFIGLATTVLLFMSPIFYPVSAIGEPYRRLLMLNPLTPAIEMSRDVLYWGRLPDPLHFAIYLVASAVVAALGFAWFQKTRKGFADVL